MSTQIATKPEKVKEEKKIPITRKTLFIHGNEAIVQGALYAGVNFYAGYPITPSSEVAESLSAKLPLRGGSYIQMEDEIASINAIIGASVAGAKSMTATSGPGFSLMQEGIGFACITETPCVIVNVQRSGPSTGLPTKVSQGDLMQAKWGTHGDHPIIAIYPSNVQEAFNFTVKAVNLSEKYRNPVILLLDEVLGHMKSKVEIPLPGEIQIFNRTKPTVPPDWYVPFEDSPAGVPPMAAFGEGYRYHITGLTHDKMGFPTERASEANQLFIRLFNKISHKKKDLQLYKEFMTDDANCAVIAMGCVTGTARQAVKMARKKRIKVGVFTPQIIWPFPEDILDTLSRKIKTFIVAELNAGQLIYEVERVVGKRAKVFGINKYDGEIFTPDDIYHKILEVLR